MKSNMTSDFARKLRTNQTDAERRLWYFLWAARLGGHKLRRQVPLEGYVLDFVCFERRLAVEVDGGQHGDVTALQRDAARTQYLELQGFRVLRFWNNEVLGNIEGVLAVISAALDEPRSESPFP